MLSMVGWVLVIAVRYLPAGFQLTYPTKSGGGGTLKEKPGTTSTGFFASKKQCKDPLGQRIGLVIDINIGAAPVRSFLFPSIGNSDKFVARCLTVFASILPALAPGFCALVGSRVDLRASRVPLLYSACGSTIVLNGS